MFIGSIFKTGLKLRQKLFITNKSAIEQQQQQLKNLLNKAKNTEFGQYYNFENILKANNNIDVFQQNIPIIDYNQMFAQ